LTTKEMKVFGDHDQKVIDQLSRCMTAEEGAEGVLCADGHYGYSMPVGGVVAYREHVSPAGVGFDIGCGNKAVLTDISADEIQGEVPRLMDEIFANISFGMGRQAHTQTPGHPVLDEIQHSPVGFQRSLLDLAAKQLGTVGGGNHYVDLFADEEDRVWVGVHFGSRGFGHKTASRYFGDGPMDRPPELLALDSDRGQEYMQAMEVAGHYAYAGRDVVVDQVLDILGATTLDSVHNHHNYAWSEEHDGQQYWVVRKGATPAFPGQRGFVGGSMEDNAVILEGEESEESASALYSTVHGAGRAMSRIAAAGKSRKRWSCNNRDCDWVQGRGEQAPAGWVGTGGNRRMEGECPKCGGDRLQKRWVREVKGAVDWAAVTDRLRERGIELRGANAEEAPEAYKRLPEVLAYHAGTVKILHTLRPLGVAMAPGDVRDEYKD
jgi:tRNA-splicing ligase RtcB